jgi:ferrochelatase
VSAPRDAVLLIGYGGPASRDEVLPFLRRVVAGRGVPDERLAAVAHHYEIVGGRSPYNDQTRDLAAGLEAWLARTGPALPVHMGMRNWHPFLEETLRAMAAAGLRRPAGVILASHRSETSWDRYRREVGEAAGACGLSPLDVRYVEPWFDDPLFLEACARRVEEASGYRRGIWPVDVPLVFTAHSIPVPMASRSPYVEDVTASCRGVAGLLGAARWRLAWQSRSGDGRVPWLEPDILDVLREEAGGGTRRVVVQAIGFLSDHVEVLYDLDVEAAGVARSLGLALVRAGCVNAHPGFVEVLGRRVRALDAAP